MNKWKDLGAEVINAKMTRGSSVKGEESAGFVLYVKFDKKEHDIINGLHVVDVTDEGREHNTVCYGTVVTTPWYNNLDTPYVIDYRAGDIVVVATHVVQRDAKFDNDGYYLYISVVNIKARYRDGKLVGMNNNLIVKKRAYEYSTDRTDVRFEDGKWVVYSKSGLYLRDAQVLDGHAEVAAECIDYDGVKVGQTVLNKQYFFGKNDVNGDWSEAEKKQYEIKKKNNGLEREFTLPNWMFDANHEKPDHLDYYCSMSVHKLLAVVTEEGEIEPLMGNAIIHADQRSEEFRFNKLILTVPQEHQKVASTGTIVKVGDWLDQDLIGRRVAYLKHAMSLFYLNEYSERTGKDMVAMIMYFPYSEYQTSQAVLL